MINKGITIQEVVRRYRAIEIQKTKPTTFFYYCDCCNNVVGIKSEIKANFPKLIQCESIGCKGYLKLGLPLPFKQPTKEFYFPSIQEAIRLRKKVRTINYILSGGVMVKDIVKE